MAKPPYSFVNYLLAEDAIDILEIILMYLQRVASNLTTISFLKFLREKIEKGELKAFKKDEWCNIFEFLDSHRDSLKQYSELECWPVLYDQFVQWVRETPAEAR